MFSLMYHVIIASNIRTYPGPNSSRNFIRGLGMLCFPTEFGPEPKERFP